MGNFIEQLSKYKPVDTCKSLDSDEVKTCFLQGLQHILNGGEVRDLFEEIDLCLEAEQYEKAKGFTHAIHHLKRYVENSTQGIYLLDMLGQDIGTEFLKQLYEIINNQMK